MIGMIRRAVDRRRAIRETAEELITRMGAGAWRQARERAGAGQTPEGRARWRKIQARIEAHDDRTARMSVRKRRRAQV